MSELSDLLFMLCYMGFTVLVAVLCYRWFDIAISHFEAAFGDERILDEHRLLPAASGQGVQDSTVSDFYISQIDEDLPALPPTPEEAETLFFQD